MSKLDETIKRLIEQKDEKDTVVRFNITLTKPQNRRAEYVARLLNKPKSTIIEDLFMSALHDLETQLGLWNEPDVYREKIYSETPIPDLFK